PGGETGDGPGAEVLSDIRIRQRNTEPEPEVVRPHRLAIAAFDRVGPVLERSKTWTLDFAVPDCDVPEMLGTPLPALLL
ncbi:hypothetical protein NLM24_36320, partial [Nocardia zapadnayensis]